MNKREKVKYRKHNKLCVLYAANKNMHYLHLIKLSEYCLVEAGCINEYIVWKYTDLVYEYEYVPKIK